MLDRIPPCGVALAAFAKGAAFLLSLTIAGAPPRAAQCNLPEDQRLGSLVSSTPVTGYVAVDGNLAVLGTAFYTDVYRHDGYAWGFEQRLTIPGGLFADAAAVRAGVVAVGRPEEATVAGTGAVYVFRHDGQAWVNTARVIAEAVRLGDAVALGLDGNLLLAGSPGAVHVFHHDGSTWTEEARLTSSAGGGSFGTSVAWSDGRALVGAPRRVGPAGANQGGAYVFRRSHGEWTQERELVAAEGNANDLLGWSVSIDRDTAVLGGLSGAPVPVRVYRSQGAAWELEQALLPAWTLYGSSVAVEGDRLMVAAQCNTGGMGGGCAGRAFLYRRRDTVWSLTTDLRTAGRNELLGAAGAMDAGRIVLWASEPYQAYAFPAAELRLTSNLTQLPPGSDVTLTVECGNPGRAVGVFVVDLGGSSQHTLLSSGTFGAGGSFVYQTVVPPGLGGLQAQVQAFGFVPMAAIGRSNRVTLQFL